MTSSNQSENPRLTREVSRHRFLQEVQKQAPQVLEKLAGKPFKCLQEFTDQIGGNEATPADISARLQRARAQNQLETRRGQERTHQAQNVLELDSALDRWASDWHLSDKWIVRAAELTLCWWLSEPGMRKERLWDLPSVSERAYRLERFVPEMPMWSPNTGISEKQYIDHGVEVARSALKAYVEQAKAAAHANDRPLASDVRGFHRTTFEHLVRFQVLGEGFTTLANEKRASPKTIRRDVGSLAEFLDITRRQGSRGRPRGSHKK